ncbi:MAG: dihydrolipoamide acetyltransferase family protein [Bacteroidetes bacterium]|nr:dihydrolipoamide acetyltransferase family protein [Bacteroidota bacterium]
MAIIEILLPKMGESVAEATITKFVVNAGERIDADEALVEIATDKVDSEVPAPENGTLVEWLVSEGDVIAVGQPIAKFDTDGVGTAEPSAPEAAAVIPEIKEEPVPEEVIQSLESPLPVGGATMNKPLNEPLDQMPSRTGSNGRFYSPLVRSIAQSEGVTLSELEAISGTGSEGRVTKKDILGYVNERSTGSSSSTMTSASNAQKPTAVASSVAMPIAAAVSVSGQDEIVEMDRMRKMIADHMVRSVQTSPHVTSFVEADMTRIVQWRNRNKDEFARAHGTKLTFTPLIAEAIIKAIRDFPGVNASVDGDRIIIKKQINLGMAAALPSGNLIVPVIHNADQLSLVGLAHKVNDLADRARNGKLKPDDTAGGTYTMSNVGTFGNVMGTPIINQPQVGILALGAIRKKPAVIETPEGDSIGIRHMMFLSHSYDHRVVDGMLGGSFVKRVAQYLEEFDLNRPVV